MSTIRVKITDSVQPEPWFASAWDDGRGPEKTVARLNKLAGRLDKLEGRINDLANRQLLVPRKVVYELATEEQYKEYRANNVKAAAKS